MTVRVVTAGLLVGVLGLASLALALAVEHHTLKQVHPFIVAHPEAFPVTPNQATLGLLAATVWLGVAFGLVFDAAPAAARDTQAALRFGVLCWLGLIAPGAALMLLWTPLPRVVVATVAAGWLLQFLAGSLVLARLLKPASPPAA